MKYPLPLFLTALVAMGGCRKLEKTPKSESFALMGSPSTIYEGVHLKISKIISAQTEIVRIDNDAGMTLRFSIESGTDGSVRLVEVHIQKQGQEESRISISSNKFSFLSSKNHDSIDSNVENAVAKIFKSSEP